ncbi:MAG TPA: YegP family protein [Micromonosporaceae bacterium]|nr:YegP family protein [Micromonosporaceae bacterium]
MKQDDMAEFDVTEAEFDAMMAESDPVEVTGPPAPVRKVCFELVSGETRAFRWRLVADDGEILATSDTSYRSREDARRALIALTAAMRAAPIVSSGEADDAITRPKAS